MNKLFLYTIMLLIVSIPALKAQITQGVLFNIKAKQILQQKTSPALHTVTVKGEATADIAHASDAFTCRLSQDKPTDYRIIQLSLGKPTHSNLKSLYAPSEDRAYRFLGDQVNLFWDDEKGNYRVSWSGELKVEIIEKYCQDKLGIKAFSPVQPRTGRNTAPSGWLSWMAFGLNVTEDKVLRNVEWLNKNLVPFGLEYCVIDDGWQGRGWGGPSNRDFYTTCYESFPHGMKWLADEIKSAGMKPGLWLIPFYQSNWKLFEENPKMFLTKTDGTTISEHTKAPVDNYWIYTDRSDNGRKDREFWDWGGRYTINVSTKDSDEHLRSLLGMMRNDWGYDYFKFDAQNRFPDRLKTYKDQMENNLGPVEAYRHGVKVSKDVVGDALILSCFGGDDALDIYDAMRIGHDAYHPLNGIIATMRHGYKNSIATWADLDHFSVHKFPMETSRLWATLAAITGQLCMISDDMPTLKEKEIQLVKMVYPSSPVRPADLFQWHPFESVENASETEFQKWDAEANDVPSVFNLKVQKEQVGEWSVVAAFNWEYGAGKKQTLSYEALGFDKSNNGFVVYDFWNDTIIEAGQEEFSISLDAFSSRLYSVRPATGHPQVVATKRHMTMGYEDLESLTWNPKVSSLNGVSKVVLHEPYEIRFHVPIGWKLKALRTSGKPGIDDMAEGMTIKDAAIDGTLGKATLISENDEIIYWQLFFEKTK